MKSFTSLSDGGNGNPPPPGVVGLNLLPPPEVVDLSVNGSSSFCSLKRKRPAKIEIPSVLQEISTEVFKSSEIQVQFKNTVCFSDSGVGVFSLKGKKKFMEDAHKIFSTSNKKKRFFGVYDGHGGTKAAEFVTDNLHLKILEMLENLPEDKAKEEAIKEGYLKTDEEFLKQGLGSGACCVTAVIEGQEMVVSNLGDCKAVLSKGGIAEALTKDHRAGQENEQKRIEDKGGYVELHRGTWRVHGILSVSRSIGDAHLKDWVLAEPDTKVISLTPEMEYLVLASDGLWDEVGNQEAIDIVTRSCSIEKKQQSMGASLKHNSNVYDCLITSPLSKSPRVSLVKSKRRQQPTSQKKTKAHRKQSEDGFSCENESPPSKARRISMVNQIKIRSPFSKNENNGITEKLDSSGGLLAACKELAGLAVLSSLHPSFSGEIAIVIYKPAPETLDTS
ncbi:unnamed protein product [Fraxinus pennsylvanica]|uniref:protein-serine/threonine phosphatase n=1 Tax=Fraxinus pennsylvanica TaxID=56036 RepID=A0AAD2A165_9LAMI|nr:unnamed protein product [Fraxinus pennsylvanica]